MDHAISAGADGVIHGDDETDATLPPPPLPSPDGPPFPNSPDWTPRPFTSVRPRDIPLPGHELMRC